MREREDCEASEDETRETIGIRSKKKKKFGENGKKHYCYFRDRGTNNIIISYRSSRTNPFFF